MLASFTSRAPVFESVRLPQASVACAALGYTLTDETGQARPGVHATRIGAPQNGNTHNRHRSRHQVGKVCADPVDLGIELGAQKHIGRNRQGEALR